MRDLETVSIAIETAETGHLVFGTLHTTTAASTIDRIIDQFPADRQSQVRVMLSESLRGVIAQTLCKKIGGGRVAAREILLSIPAVSNLIREGKTFQIPSIMQTNRKTGMVTLNDALMELVDSQAGGAEGGVHEGGREGRLRRGAQGQAARYQLPRRGMMVAGRTGGTAEGRSGTSGTSALRGTRPAAPPVPPSGPILVLVNPQDIVNIASAVRIAQNFGIERMRLVNPETFDPWRIEGIAHNTRRLRGAESRSWTRWRPRSPTASHVAVLTARERDGQAADRCGPARRAAELVERSAEGPVAIVSGREDRGLTNAELDLGHVLVTIPTDPRELRRSIWPRPWRSWPTRPGSPAGESAAAQAAPQEARRRPPRPSWRSCSPTGAGRSGRSTSSRPAARRA